MWTADNARRIPLRLYEVLCSPTAHSRHLKLSMQYILPLDIVQLTKFKFICEATVMGESWEVTGHKCTLTVVGHRLFCPPFRSFLSAQNLPRCSPSSSHIPKPWTSRAPDYTAVVTAASTYREPFPLHLRFPSSLPFTSVVTDSTLPARIASDFLVSPYRWPTHTALSFFSSLCAGIPSTLRCPILRFHRVQAPCHSKLLSRQIAPQHSHRYIYAE